MKKRTINRTRLSMLSISAIGAALGCNALDEKQASPIENFVRIVPTDTRPVSQPEVAPPPITGGTLLTFGQQIAVADPARDRITLKQIGSSEMREVQLAVGAQPFRMTHDADGGLYVVLRGTGEVARIDVDTATVAASSSVCAAPRGIDYDAPNDELVVACAEGKLLNLVPATLDLKSEMALEPDIRDVVVDGERRYVSRFRSAEVLFVEQGTIINRVKPPEAQQFAPDRAHQIDGSDFRTLRPTVAWRMVADPIGGVMVSHQRAVIDPVGVDPHADGDSAQNSLNGAAGGSPYGGSGNCDGIVQSSVTAIAKDGSTTSSLALAGLVMPVDLAVSSDGQTIAVANAGLRPEDAPAARLEFVSDPSGGDDFFGGTTQDSPQFFGGGTTLLLPREFLHRAEENSQRLGGCDFSPGIGGQVPGISVAFTEGREVLIQERGAAQLHEVSLLTLETVRHSLGGREIAHTGQEIFHRDSGGGLACASCHPEGADDGNVWTFSGIGPRRTQSLELPLENTAPFHWDGSLENLSVLMDDVFVERMGGVFQSKERLASLEDWMFSRVAPQVPAGDTEAVARGKKLFHSTATACGTCHSGSGFTDNESYDVGTTLNEERLQVPPLNGLLLRPPYMHNGCAKTLHQRFDAECGGGDAHGHTSQLSQTEIDDLVAYLGSL